LHNFPGTESFLDGEQIAVHRSNNQHGLTYARLTPAGFKAAAPSSGMRA